jgi:hypothetical protein
VFDLWKQSRVRRKHIAHTQKVRHPSCVWMPVHSVCVCVCVCAGSLFTWKLLSVTSCCKSKHVGSVLRKLY